MHGSNRAQKNKKLAKTLEEETRDESELDHYTEDETDDELNDGSDESVNSEGASQDGDSSGSDSEVDGRLKALQRELEKVPDSQLREIERKIGVKLLSDDDGDSNELGEASSKKSTGPKRRRKHRPTVMSSKKPVSVLRTVAKVPGKKSRDPRFDTLSGRFNQDLFEKSYSFLNEYRQTEMDQVREQLRKEKNRDEREKLNRLLTKMKSQAAAEERMKRTKQIQRERKKQEMERVTKGKKPFFLKKSEGKKLELIDKFNTLQAKNPRAIDKLIEKRRKRNAAKEHKRVPSKRRRLIESDSKKDKPNLG